MKINLSAIGLALFLAFSPDARAAEAVPPEPPPLDCTGFESNLFLARGNILLSNLRWRAPGTGQIGCGQAIANREDTGHFWFFDRENIELTCKAINGLLINQRFWIFCGGLTDVEWWVDVRNNGNPDLPGKSYYNPPGRMASFADTDAVGHGANNAPYFALARTECGQEQTGSTGSFLMLVRDPDGDMLNAQVRVLEGNSAALQIVPVWKGPFQGSQAGSYLWFDVKAAPASGTHRLALEVSDGKSLLPSQCTATLRVP